MNVRPRFCGCAVLRIVLLALAVLVLCACQPTEVLTERVSRGDWSRGLLLGASSLAEGAPLSVNPVDGSLRIFWVGPPASGATAVAIHMAHLDAAGRVLSSGPLPLEVARPTDLRVEGAASGPMSLFWLDGTSGRRTVWRASLSAEGDVVSASALPAVGGQALDTAPDPAGGVHVVWCADDAAAGALHYAHVPSGSGAASAALDLGVSCLVPAVAVDATGLLHVVWTGEPDSGLRDIHYATLNPAMDALTDVTLLATLPVPTGQVLRDPALGISADGITVFWAVERRGGGLAPPSATSRRVFIPGGRATEASPPEEVIVPPQREPAVIETQTGFHLKWLAPATRDAGESEFVYYAAPLSTLGTELPVAFSAQLVGRTKSVQQIILTLWSAGEMTAYQVVAQTASTSLHPMLASDAGNDLYVTWVDTAGFGSYKVYVAGTSDAMRSTLDRWRPLDVATVVLDFLWGVVQAAGFLPIAVVWLMPSLIVLAIYAVIHPDADLSQRGTRLMLVLAGVLYEATKIVIRPAWLTQFPVPSWVSPALTDRVILLAPLAIAGLSGLLTTLWARRRDYASLFPAYFVFAGCDVMLTLLVYVPAVLSE